MSSPRIDAHVLQRALPFLGMRTRNNAPTIPYSSLDGDRGMDRCHYAVPFKGNSIRSTPELFFHLNETNNFKKAKMKGGLSWMTNYYRE